MIAKKLSIQDMSEFLLKELEGYSNRDKLPYYRLLSGQPYITDLITQSSQPLPIIGKDTEWLSVLPFRESISSLQHTIDNNENYIELKCPDETEKLILELMTVESHSALGIRTISNEKHRYRPFLVFPTGRLNDIVNMTRKMILDWALKLEEEGILGEGLAFTEKEKNMTQNFTYNIAGPVANMANHNEGSTVNQTTSNSFNTGDFQALSDELQKIGVDLEDIKQLKDILAEESQQKNEDGYGEKVTSWIKNVCVKSMSTVTNIGKAIAPAAILALLKSYFGW